MRTVRRPASCEASEEWIALDAGGDLDGARAAVLEEHLGACPRCRAFAGAMTATRQSLRRHAEPPADEEVFARIRAGVRQEIESGAGAAVALPFRPPWRRTAPRVLALAASLVLAVALWRLGRTEPPAAAPPPAQAPPPVETGTAPVPEASPAPPVSPPPAASSPVPAARRDDTVTWLDSTDEVSDAIWLDPRPTEASDAIWLAPPRPKPQPIVRKLYTDDDVVVYWLAEPADNPKEKDDAQTTIL